MYQLTVMKKISMMMMMVIEYQTMKMMPIMIIQMLKGMIISGMILARKKILKWWQLVLLE